MEMGESLSYGSSQCNEIQAPLKSTAEVTFLLQEFMPQAVARVKDKF